MPPKKNSTPDAEPSGKPTRKPTGGGGMAATKRKPPLKPDDRGVILLSGGNPQIAKGDGDAPVRAYLDAVPVGWKQDLARRIDTLIEGAVPGVSRAVRWNSPFYGVEGRGFFASFHILTRYIKLTFFEGTSLNPMPPGFTEKSGNARWIDIYMDTPLDEAQLTAWLKQAAALPGWKP